MIPGSQLCYLGVNYDTGESIMLPGSQLWYLRVNYDTEESQLVISDYLRLFFKVSKYLYRGTEGILYNNQNVKKVINEDYIFYFFDINNSAESKSSNFLYEYIRKIRTILKVPKSYVVFKRETL